MENLRESEFEGVTGTGRYSWKSQDPEYTHLHRGFSIVQMGERWLWWEVKGVFGTADSLEQARERVEEVCRRAIVR